MILQNQIKCKKCGTVVSSLHRHDYNVCACGIVSADGGYDYLKRMGSIDDWEEQSVIIDDDLGWILIDRITNSMGDRNAFVILSGIAEALIESGASNVLEALANPNLCDTQDSSEDQAH